METVVIFNMGKDAKRAGLPCVAPNTVQYPVVSKYEGFHQVEAALDHHMKLVWVNGYNA